VKILLVEDEAAIADFVVRALEADGYSVEQAADGRTGERLALDGDFDLAILDIALPGRNGIDVLTSVRTVKPALPVILLTARSQLSDKVAGLDAGATDYVAKPFSVEELLARVRAHLRLPLQDETTRLSVAGLDVDLMRRTATNDGAEVQLSATEFELLAYFMRHPGEVLTREQILNAVWGYDPETNIVDVYVGYLRRKLASAGRAAPIETVRAAGYRLVPG
jgi:two-component system, OmpR family, response regulator